MTKLEITTESPETGNEFFSNEKFGNLQISENIKTGIKEAGFETLTEIQAKAIPRMLQGKDVLAAAKTGSGKTLAFLIPILESLVKSEFPPSKGTAAMVISPTRELSIQTYDVCVQIGKYVPQTFGLVMGGANRKNEASKLSKGVAIVVATPGRLLDHLQNTKGFVVSNMKFLVIDEADRILAIGFEEEINQIIRLLPQPPQRQTALFSATQSPKIKDLARLSLTKPIFIQASSRQECISNGGSATVLGLEQGYVICEGAKRFRLLFTFLRKNKDKKIMVFFSSCMSVKFHEELLNYVDLKVLAIHGRKKQSARMTTFYEFCSIKEGTLLCTDVAARGLDIPKVDWIIQYDPADDPKEYIHRVGRTARGAFGVGKALLFLLPSETDFLKYLKKSGAILNEFLFSENKLANVQHQLERLIEKNYHLHRASRDAYRSYLHAYASHSLKDIFNVGELDLQEIAQGFGFSAPPKIDLNLKYKSRTIKSKHSKGLSKSSGHTFSAANPMGKRKPSDKRQFSR